MLIDDAIMNVVNDDRLAMMKPLYVRSSLLRTDTGEVYGDLNGGVLHCIDCFQSLQ